MSLFRTNMAISELKSQGCRAIPTQRTKASDILTSILAAFLFSSHPKRERDREVHLNYYASTQTGGNNYHTTRQNYKSNMTKTSNMVTLLKKSVLRRQSRQLNKLTDFASSSCLWQSRRARPSLDNASCSWFSVSSRVLRSTDN